MDESVKKGHLSVTGDAAIRGAMKQLTPLYSICSAHNLSNILKRLFEFKLKEVLNTDQYYRVSSFQIKNVLKKVVLNIRHIIMVFEILIL